MRNCFGFVAFSASVCMSVCAPGRAQTTQPAMEIDACGVLVRGAECIVFEAGGLRYFLSDYGGYQVGDSVRVVGFVNPDCLTICQDVDACISGATVYDPDVLPCGTPLPDFPGDLCTAAAGALASAIAAGLYFTRRRQV